MCQVTTRRMHDKTLVEPSNVASHISQTHIFYHMFKVRLPCHTRQRVNVMHSLYIALLSPNVRTIGTAVSAGNELVKNQKLDFLALNDKNSKYINLDGCYRY